MEANNRNLDDNPFVKKRSWLVRVKDEVIAAAYLVALMAVLIASIVGSMFLLDRIPLWQVALLCLLPILLLVLVLVVISFGVFQRKMDHPRFGRLLYEKLARQPLAGPPSRYKGTWDGMVCFLSDGNSVGLLMRGDGQGPDKGFELLFVEFEECYVELLPNIAEACWQAYHTWFKDNAQAATNPEQLLSELELLGVLLSDVDLAEIHLHFTVPHDTGGHILFVSLRHWQGSNSGLGVTPFA